MHATNSIGVVLVCCDVD